MYAYACFLCVHVMSTHACVCAKVCACMWGWALRWGWRALRPLLSTRCLPALGHPMLVLSDDSNPTGEKAWLES